MRKIKQIDRPYAVTRTMPSGEQLYSVAPTLESARFYLNRLPKKQLPAWIKYRRGGGVWECIQQRAS